MPTTALDSIRIASPCPAKWEEMTGDDCVRFCRLCERSVYNLSTLTRQEAERLIAEKEGRLCARLFRRSDGTILTRDCPVGIRARLRRSVRLITATTAALAGTFILAMDVFLLAVAGRQKPEPPTVQRKTPPAAAPAAGKPRPLSPEERKHQEELLGSLGYIGPD